MQLLGTGSTFFVYTALASSHGSHRTCGVESVAYRFQVTDGPVNISDAVADCRLLPAA
jgi:hypothetical protein